MKNILFILTLTFSLFAQYEWSTPKMLSNPASNYCSYPQLVLDKNGVLHAVWMNYYDTGDLVEPIVLEHSYSSDNGANWSTPAVITPIIEGDKIYEPKIVCDSNNNLHIVFYLVLSGKIYYMNNTSGNWSTPQFTGYYLTSQPILDIDNNDKLYFFYYSGASSIESSLYITKEPLNNWTTPVKISAKFSIDDTKVFNGYLYAGGSVMDDAYGWKSYITRLDISTGVWEPLHDVSSGKFFTTIRSIDISNDNKVHIAYLDGMYTGQTYTKYFTSDLDFNNISDVDSVSYGLYDPKLIVDSNATPHIFEDGKLDDTYYLIYSSKESEWWQQIIRESSYYFDKLFPLYNMLDRFYIIYRNNRQVYFQTALQTGIEQEADVIPGNFNLSNYPNPFNSSTEINFTLSNSAEINLVVYNSNGEFIQNLVSDKLNKGKHSFSFKSDNLNSGVYFYRLSVDGATKETRKMLYLR